MTRADSNMWAIRTFLVLTHARWLKTPGSMSTTDGSDAKMGNSFASEKSHSTIPRFQFRFNRKCHSLLGLG
jgi:hypothetical protein